ncbi:olfactory receptor 14A16-like [Struthio camelus]|uniref:olfactory receptor 14A16-like n=1 Tax=Struthio camelus TaxID=8801 RepID=UPI00360417DB
MDFTFQKLGMIELVTLFPRSPYCTAGLCPLKPMGRGPCSSQQHTQPLQCGIHTRELPSGCLSKSPMSGESKKSNDSSFNEFLLLAFADTRELQLLHFSLFLVMAYDRYVAICRPLHYGTLMGTRACVRMAAAAWASGFLCALLHTANTFSIPLCQGNVLDQFFCEIPQILKLSCSHSYLREIWLNVVSACLFLGCFVFIVLSYVQIFRAVLRMPSEQGRHKAFSMCLPHLVVVSLFISTSFFAYLKPPSMSSPALDLVVAVLYAVMPPAVNPLIYSMRNKELKEALKKLIQLVLVQQH